MSFITDKPVKANRGRKSRKTPGKAMPHICVWCGGAIAIGRPAYSLAGVYEGDFWHDYMHVECWHAAEYAMHHADKYGDGDGVDFSQGWARGRVDSDRSQLAEFSSILPGTYTGGIWKGGVQP